MSMCSLYFVAVAFCARHFWELVKSCSSVCRKPGHVHTHTIGSTQMLYRIGVEKKRRKEETPVYFSLFR